MGEKRKLKPIQKRRPKHMVGMQEFIQDISDETGFTTKDVRMVWHTGINILIGYLLEGRSLLLYRIGMIYPIIKPSRMVTSLKGNNGTPEKMEMPARWIVKFRPGEFVKKKMLEKPPTKEEINNLYIK